MAEEQCKIHFDPDNVEITVEQGTNLLQAAIKAGVHISASCGGLGVCGTCKVKIESGNVKSLRTERIGEDEYIRGIRQACQCQVLSDLTVTVPVESRLDKAVRSRERILTSGISATDWKYNPPIIKYYLELPPATLKDNATDYFRMMYGLNRSYGLPDWPSDFEVIRKLPSVLRQNNWKVTVTMMAVSDRPPGQEEFTYKITNIEPGDTRNKIYALAIDVGTTTICAQLLDLNRGEILADTIVFNRQTSYGADVISRIIFCQKPDGLKKLQKVVVESINEAIDNLLDNSRIDRKDISHITVAGNTTMQHILVNLDPKNIRLSPYTPVANFIPLTKAAPLGINVPDHVYVFNFPSVSSYVGGDIIAGVIASGMHQRKHLTLYVDIGTNGETVVGNSEWMVSASCSAGPAFEGGGIKHGMVAMSGAIQDFSIDPTTLEPTIKTINDARPVGICGSGLIHILAELLLGGVVGQNGKFIKTTGSNRIRKNEDGYEYVLVWANDSQTGQDITISEVDIDNLIRAKAAMYAGFTTLIQNVGVSTEDLDQVILAGNFGNSLDIGKAITIGLLPDIPLDRFVFIGNGSLAGARMVNFSTDLLDQSRMVAQMMTNIELSENSTFSDNYIAAMFLPHTDEKSFPTVMQKIKRL